MSNRPEKVFQNGAVRAAIFVNERERDGQSFTTRQVSFQKLYRDKDGEFKATNSLDINDLPKAVIVLQKAYDYLTVRQEFEDSPADF
jgi:hypothetical protein